MLSTCFVRYWVELVRPEMMIDVQASQQWLYYNHRDDKHNDDEYNDAINENYWTWQRKCDILRFWISWGIFSSFDIWIILSQGRKSHVSTLLNKRKQRWILFFFLHFSWYFICYIDWNVYTQMLFHLSLSDPSLIMLSLTNSLTDTCLVDLIDVTPALGWLGHNT